MKLVVISHKPSWPSASSPSGYATDGGFPFQMRALSDLFDATTLVVPCSSSENQSGGTPLSGHNLCIAQLTLLAGSGLWRRLRVPVWLARNGLILFRQIRRADAVHAPIPGDIGTIGLIIAFVLQKPLFVRHCGNWFVQRTAAEHFWKWFMERFAGGQNVMLATGGASEQPSRRSPHVRWIFSTSLTERELKDCSRRRRVLRRGQARLITICRQERGKGSDVVIESLPLILKNFPAVTLDVVGDGNRLAEFQRKASAIGVADRVTFHGRVAHKTAIHLLQHADLFCFPTSSEGFPKVVLEALACGLPVVTTRVSVLPQLIETGCGQLIEKPTPEAVADAVRLCLSNGQRYSVMSAQAVDTARKYSLERWRDTIGDLLQTAWGPLKASF